ERRDAIVLDRQPAESAALSRRGNRGRARGERLSARHRAHAFSGGVPERRYADCARRARRTGGAREGSATGSDDSRRSQRAWGANLLEGRRRGVREGQPPGRGLAGAENLGGACGNSSIMRKSSAILATLCGVVALSAHAEQKPLWEFGMGVGALAFPDY